MKIIDKIFNYFSINFNNIINIFHIVNFSYLYLFFGLDTVIFNESFIREINTILQLLVCLFLIYRFNPFKNDLIISNNDKRIIFSSAVFLFINLGVVEYLHQKMDEIKSHITPFIRDQN